jgi:hypothetical protein
MVPGTIDERPAAAWPRALLWPIAAVLLVSAAYHLGRGFYTLSVSPTAFPIDLRLRWAEQRYIVRHGQDPFDLYFAYQPEGPVVPPRPIARDATIDPDLGPVPQLAYPPWTYALGSLIWWPPWPQVRWWAALIDLLGLALIAGWAYQTGRRASRAEGVVVALVSLACSHYYTLLAIGQLAIVILAFLVAALLFDRAGKDALSGLMLGMAMIKPTIALPFFLIPLVRGRWASLAIGAAAVGLGTAAVWARTGVNPVEMLQQVSAVAEQIEVPKGEPGPVTWLIGLGLSVPVAMKAAMAAAMAASAAAMWTLRRSSVEVLYAIAAVTARFWTHLKAYDEVVLLLLVVPLVALALRAPRPRWLPLLAAVVAVSVLEIGLSHVLSATPRAVLQVVATLAGLVAYLAYEPGALPARAAVPERAG